MQYLLNTKRLIIMNLILLKLTLKTFLLNKTYLSQKEKFIINQIASISLKKPQISIQKRFEALTKMLFNNVYLHSFYLLESMSKLVENFFNMIPTKSAFHK